MARKDHYYNKAKQEGYRTRAAYKLKQLDEQADLFAPGDTVVDLGAAPGGWLQVAAEAVGPDGTVVGVDRQRIDELDHDNVELVRGDMTEERTRDRVRRALGADEGERAVDVVVSDMAPNMTGEYELDHARSVHLARMAAETADALLRADGDLVVKVFEGRDVDDLRADLEESFEYVRSIHPDASRDESSEVYLVAKHHVTAPVAEGDRLTVDIESVGEEGDAIAKVDGYTLFVAGADEGETLRVQVTDVKAEFGFAELIEG